MLLSTASYDDTPAFTLEPCVAKVLDVYDADTVDGSHRSFSGRISRWQVRIVGVDCPEIRPKRGNPHRLLEKQAAIVCRDALIEYLTGLQVRGKMTRSKIRSILSASERLVRLEPKGFDKYGRVLADIKLPDNGMSAVNRLIGGGFARSYRGGTRSPWTEEELTDIVRSRVAE